MSKSKQRPIRTDYYLNHKLIYSTHSVWAVNAVANAAKHLRSQRYPSTHCEVYDTVNGTLHGVVKYVIGKNEIKILFEREVSKKDYPPLTKRKP